MTNTVIKAESTAVPFGVCCAGIATFAMMDGVMKSLSIEMGAYNAILWRMCFGFTFASILYAFQFERWPDRNVIRLHLWRAFVIAIMAYLFFWALAVVPLAEAIGLSFIAPLIAIYLAAVILGESIGKRAIQASMIGFLGTIVVVAGQLKGEYGDGILSGIIAILLSAVMYGYNLILQRQQALVAKPGEIAFFQNTTILFLYALLAPFFAVLPTVSTLPTLALAAALAIVSLLMISWAYARAEAKVLIPVEYTAFVWAVIIGWMFYDEALTLSTVAGTALIVWGCVIASNSDETT